MFIQNTHTHNFISIQTSSTSAESSGQACIFVYMFCLQVNMLRCRMLQTNIFYWGLHHLNLAPYRNRLLILNVIHGGNKVSSSLMNSWEARSSSVRRCSHIIQRPNKADTLHGHNMRPSESVLRNNGSFTWIPPYRSIRGMFMRKQGDKSREDG